MKAIINAALYDYENYHENKYILFDDSIKEIGDMKNFHHVNCEIIDADGCIVMPAFADSHSHIYSTFARGLNIPFNPKSFRDILEQLWWKLDSKLDLESTYYSGLVSGCEFIKNGVTSIIDHHASGTIKGTLNELKKAVCDYSGLRGIFCFETSDRFNVDDCIEENVSFAQTKSEFHCGLFGLHASMTLSDETLEKVSRSRNNIPIHIHIAESLEDEADSVMKSGLKIIDRLQKYELLDEKSILAHCVHIGKKEAEIIASFNSNIVLNPTSNMNNAVGISNYKMFRNNNIKVMLGNDGFGFNLTRDIYNFVFSEKNRYTQTTSVTFEDAKKLLKNNYKYISILLNIKLGKIEEGYKADLIVVPYDPITPLNEKNIDGHIFFGIFDNFKPRDVLCNGRILMKNYNLLADAENIYKEAREVSKKLWEKIEG